ncbi:tRNA (adenosine(37)-N6)-threonylcarbamoyltransferase complex transferase subunit TsaD [Candidatus Dojkabacteria bacterium HGW-Dojkabacteria-1]|uniref:tRNA N6-adenosine threonylcarbamoyltransferase n=1 Tax=Candidatus Dojkabacteria bacterium HGW-Dojkabacteria-1 TaxID=2013761 RepID=A0A2N2F396_9BACT|nr:MAG: tRNA (adenosine(37)-N6)-threonylcarbamoyltransferase complex transferase subunit TsaD [Candidatus Dojkabacteria bacterium HGW-Dojkabacteria-1]
MVLTKEILKEKPLILAIDTSCDDTSVALLRGREVLNSELSSQIELHSEFGGVVPDLARRLHEENIEEVYNKALNNNPGMINNVDYIAVTTGPGLAIDLEVGLKFAKDLADRYNKPFVPVNHMEGHLFSSLLLNSKGNGLVSDEELVDAFPAIALLMSGKHTEIVYVESIGEYKKLGQTLDDAAGEAFDKVGRVLNLGYPGGPVVTEFAKRGKSGVIKFTTPMKNSGDLNFSYSGLKTAALYKSKELREKGIPEREWIYDFCRGFLDAVVDSVVIKLQLAIEKHPEVKTVFVGGGVFNSEEILRKVGNTVRSYNLNYYFPEIEYRSDNAAMIGVSAYLNILQGKYITDKDEIEEIDRDPRLSL